MTFPQYSLTSTSELADDHFVLTNVVLPNTLNLSVAAPLARRENGNQLDALYVTITGELDYVSQSQGQTGGWVSPPLPASSNVAEVVAGYQLDGNYYAFYQDGTALYRLKAAPANGASLAWEADATLACAAFLGVTYDLDGGLVVYGLTEGGGAGASLQICYWSDGAWQTQSVVLPQFQGTSAPIQLNMATQPAWTLAVVTTEQGSGTAIGYVYLGNTTSNLLSAPTAVTVGGTQIQPTLVTCPFPLPDGAGFIFGDATGALYASGASSTSLSQILQHNTSFLSANGFMDENDQIQLMVVDTNNALWQLQQANADGNQPTFGPMVPLDQNSNGCLFDPGVPTPDALMGIDQNMNLKSIVQDTATSGGATVGTIWRSYQVPLAQSQVLSLPTYRSRILITDTYGRPVANAPVSIAVDRTVPLWSGGQCYIAAPNAPTPVTLTTDGAGYITVAIQATELMTATLTPTCAGQQLDPVVPHAQLHAFLAGSGSLNYSGGGSLQTPLAFSNSSLANATTMNSNGSTGGTVAPGLGGDAGSALTGTVVQAVQAGMSMAAQATAAARAGHPHPLRAVLEAGTTGMTVVMQGDGGPSCQNGVDYSIFGENCSLSNIDSWTTTALNGLDSLWNGIKNGVADIFQFVVDVANEIVVFTAEIAGAVYTFCLDILDGIESVISTVQAIFAAIGADIDSLLSWLRALFDWTNILNTKLNIDPIIAGLPTSLTNDLSSIQSSIDSDLNLSEQEIESFFSTLESKLGSFTMSELLSGASATALMSSHRRGGKGLGAAAASPPDVHSSWFLDKIQTIFQAITGWTFSGTLPTQEMANTFTTALAAIAGDAVDAGTSLLSAVEAAFTGDYGSNTVSQMLSDLENGVEDILQALITLVNAVFAVVEDAISALGAMLEQPFTFGGIGALLDLIYSLAGGTPPAMPSTAEVMSWILAVPITLGYELLNSGNPPFTAAPGLGGLGATEASAVWAACTGLGAYVWSILDCVIDMMPTDQGIPFGFSFPVGQLRSVIRFMAAEAYDFNDYEASALELDMLLGVFNIFMGLIAYMGNSPTGKSLRFASPPWGPAAVMLAGIGQLYYMLSSPESDDQTFVPLILPFYNILEIVHVSDNPYALVGKGVFNYVCGTAVLVETPN